MTDVGATSVSSVWDAHASLEIETPNTRVLAQLPYGTGFWTNDQATFHITPDLSMMIFVERWGGDLIILERQETFKGWEV